MTKINFGLVGAGGFGREVMPHVRACASRALSVEPDEISLYFVETWEPERPHRNGYPLISLDAFRSLNGPRYFNVAVGNGRARDEIARAVGSSAEPLLIVAPQTIFLDENSIGDGSIFCPYTIVTSNATIGRFFHANIYSYVAHDCVIGDFVTFAPGVRCNGHVHVGDFAYIGTNAVIREGRADKPLRIGAGAVVGMGAVVTRDVPDGETVVGNPARPHRKP